uniref:hydroxysteroid dehydrogenase-like protein 2 n=1 Tax=Ciona intestinalis TaxID=7719 RepID=UPI000180CDB5|nr:hydroxysteroid dehydrogenase-like protein 2 [Ciona intestinalis]|eukprot:XP_002120177.1 hydroxysteroid dehydrogenase-like protein 2 [Ciona intestinalis]
MAGKLAGYTLFITGASRGIGKAIGLRAARDGANVVIAAKTAEAHPKLPGTIYTAAKEIEDAGGKCLPCIVDVRDEAMVEKAVKEAVSTFGGIDILVNNASAISLTGTEVTKMKTYDLMNQVNTRGTYLCSKVCVPHLLDSKKRGKSPHILNISPPLSMKPMWFKNHTAYTIAKYGMSMCVLGMAAEFEESGIAVNALWPKTAILTAAMEMLGGKDVSSQCRKPEIMADAAYAILKQETLSTGKFFIDDEVLAKEGVTDFDQYAVEPGKPLILDFFLEDNEADFKGQEADFQGQIEKAKAASKGGEIVGIFNNIKNALSTELVAQTKGVFKFEIKDGDAVETWVLDLKNGEGKVTKGDGDSDVVMKMASSDFVSMFQGKLNSTAAFMQGKLKIDGNMILPMKLEHLMTKMQKAKL